MSRSGPRPHTWKIPGEIPHQQYISWLQMKAQAMYRKELFLLTFEEYQRIWADNWHKKGRGTDDYCLTREDSEGAWEYSNVYCIPRIEHLRRQKQYKQGMKYGKSKGYKVST